MTSKFSIDNRELLQRISSGEAVVGIDFGNLIVRELAAFRMDAMDCEPVAENIRIADALEGLLWPNMAIGNKAVIQEAIEALRAYHAQPATVVPTFEEWLELRGNKPLGWVKDAMRESYDACRAAMLNGGKP
ncbi:hypothetical protein J9B54_00975 [Klebsiella pneumoniae]|nr:hypothetical protein [Klebsiella pneumoniae]HBW4388781.1 hypothetical protein [Klebsiella pneumoniae]